MKYLRRIRRIQQQNEAASKNNEVQSEVVEGNETLNNVEDDLLYLKTTILGEENIERIKKKLKATADYRTEMISDPNIDFLESFPYLFTNPELVSS